MPLAGIDQLRNIVFQSVAENAPFRDVCLTRNKNAASRITGPTIANVANGKYKITCFAPPCSGFVKKSMAKA